MTVLSPSRADIDDRPVRTSRTKGRGPAFRELTYAYRTKTDRRGRPISFGPVLKRPVDVAPLLMMLLAHEAVEVFGILCLTARRHIICWHEVSRGCLDGAHAHPREVFKPAFLVNAASVICAHNHPSGDPQPSTADLALTRRLVDAGQLLSLPVLDHFIVGSDSFVSLGQLVGPTHANA